LLRAIITELSTGWTGTAAAIEGATRIIDRSYVICVRVPPPDRILEACGPRAATLATRTRRTTMRVFRVCGVAAVAALLTSAAWAQEKPDADRKVAGGGVTVNGWQGKADIGNKQGLTVNDSKFAPEGTGFRLVTGPAGVYWNPANTAKGDYSVKATFKEAKQTYNHPHPFGVFIGGTQLDTDTPSMLYCVAYRDGTFLVRQFVAGKVNTIVRKTPHESVAKAAGPDAEVTQEVGWVVKGPRVECSVNGAMVWGADKSEIPGFSSDGVTGIRVSHNSDALVTNFALGK
jgi:hypothetical protein